MNEGMIENEASVGTGVSTHIWLFYFDVTQQRPLPVVL